MKCAENRPSHSVVCQQSYWTKLPSKGYFYWSVNWCHHCYHGTLNNVSLTDKEDREVHHPRQLLSLPLRSTLDWMKTALRVKRCDQHILKQSLNSRKWNAYLLYNNNLWVLMLPNTWQYCPPTIPIYFTTEILASYWEIMILDITYKGDFKM